MGEKELREKAISRYENGESPKHIYQSFGRSNVWFFKWLKRYQRHDPDWSTDLSRKPYTPPARIKKHMEQAIINIRKQLEKTPYAQIGALTIQWHLEQKGFAIPLSTINKVIKRNHLIRKKPVYQSKSINYPALEVTRSNVLHQFDVVGPRYLKSDGPFYSANIIDAYDRRCVVNPLRRQTKTDIIHALIRSWQMLGLPQYLQMDNKLSLRGSNRYPHSVGLVIRLCLYLGIQPVFIPIQEPWRNGIIEKFQDVFDKTFFRVQRFKNFRQVAQQASKFERFHNQHHRYSTLAGKTPEEKMTGKVHYLPKNFVVPERLNIAPGFIHLIRFIRSTRMLDIFGEKFSLPVELTYQYVWTTIDSEQQILAIYHEKKLVKKFKYPLPKTVIKLSKIEL
jgi:transposase InsO family protein